MSFCAVAIKPLLLSPPQEVGGIPPHSPSRNEILDSSFWFKRNRNDFKSYISLSIKFSHLRIGADENCSLLVRTAENPVYFQIKFLTDEILPKIN